MILYFSSSIKKIECNELMSSKSLHYGTATIICLNFMSFSCLYIIAIICSFVLWAFWDYCIVWFFHYRSSYNDPWVYNLQTCQVSSNSRETHRNLLHILTKILWSFVFFAFNLWKFSRISHKASIKPWQF